MSFASSATRFITGYQTRNSGASGRAAAFHCREDRSQTRPAPGVWRTPDRLRNQRPCSGRDPRGGVDEARDDEPATVLDATDQLSGRRLHVRHELGSECLDVGARSGSPWNPASPSMPGTCRTAMTTMPASRSQGGTGGSPSTTSSTWQHREGRHLPRVHRSHLASTYQRWTPRPSADSGEGGFDEGAGDLLDVTA